MKIGVVITTYNNESCFETLFNSLPDDKYDELVVVNGGKPYNTTYKRMHGEVHWIQHEENYGPARSRNDGLKRLHELGCDYMFLIEDDMIIKSENVFDAYINAHKTTGLQYFCFVSYPWEAGPIGERTPRLKVQYTPEIQINFYKNSCNEFTFRTKSLYEKTQPYNENYFSCFDVDNYFRITQLPEGHCFWYSPDLSNSDDLIVNNTASISKMDAEGSRMAKLGPDYNLFKSLYGCLIHQIPDTPKEKVIEKLKTIKDNKI